VTHDRSADDGSPGRGRSLASPHFPDDDGSAAADVRELVGRASAGEIDPVSAARALRDVRLLSSVVAVLDEAHPAGGDKDSHMAVVSMVNDAGEKGLLAFTGVDALAAWSADARPVPALGREVARAALDDDATAVVIDVSGPARLVLAGPLLHVLADRLDLARVTALVQAALAPLTADGWTEVEVADARPLGAQADVVVELRTVGGGHPDGRLDGQLAQQAATILARRADIQRLAPGGIGVLVR
jgi:hypothetical protein